MTFGPQKVTGTKHIFIFFMIAFGNIKDLLAQIASTSTTAPSSSLSGDSGPSKAMVKEVQMLLRVLRFGPGVADGIMGPKTEEAVRAFQRSKGMYATGEISSYLLKELRQEYRRKYPSQ